MKNEIAEEKDEWTDYLIFNFNYQSKP